MLTEYPFSAARRNLTEVIDLVQRFSPVVIRPRKRSEEPCVILPKSLLIRLLDPTTLPVAVKPAFAPEPDGSITLLLEALAIVANGATREEAIAEAVADAIEYAQEYLSPENVAFYLRAPNRCDHFPLVLRIGLCDSDAEVMALLNLA